MWPAQGIHMTISQMRPGLATRRELLLVVILTSILAAFSSLLIAQGLTPVKIG
jgi:hypothetical protein